MNKEPDPKEIVQGHHGMPPEDDWGELRETPQDVVPASQPMVRTTEEERRAQEARDYLASLPQHQRQRTEEELQAIRAETLASVPMANGVPIPEPSGLTQEQMRNNPSNYQPAIEDFVAKSGEQAVATVTYSAPQEKPVKAAEIDNRQWWVCVQSDGIRTMDNAGQVHPAFQSDVHLMDVMVRCPVCESVSVRKVQPGEDLEVTVRAAAWTRERTKLMGLNPILRQ
jgi:hypothetical protein